MFDIRKEFDEGDFTEEKLDRFQEEQDLFTFTLPKLIDKTPRGKIVEKASIGEKGYSENVEFMLKAQIVDGEVELLYYGEDDTYLDVKEVIKAIKIYND